MLPSRGGDFDLAGECVVLLFASNYGVLMGRWSACRAVLTPDDLFCPGCETRVGGAVAVAGATVFNSQTVEGMPSIAVHSQATVGGARLAEVELLGTVAPNQHYLGYGLTYANAERLDPLTKWGKGGAQQVDVPNFKEVVKPLDDLIGLSDDRSPTWLENTDNDDGWDER